MQHSTPSWAVAGVVPQLGPSDTFSWVWPGHTASLHALTASQVVPQQIGCVQGT